MKLSNTRQPFSSWSLTSRKILNITSKQSVILDTFRSDKNCWIYKADIIASFTAQVTLTLKLVIPNTIHSKACIYTASLEKIGWKLFAVISNSIRNKISICLQVIFVQLSMKLFLKPLEMCVFRKRICWWSFLRHMFLISRNLGFWRIDNYLKPY